MESETIHLGLIASSEAKRIQKEVAAEYTDHHVEIQAGDMGTGLIVPHGESRFDGFCLHEVISLAQ